jgi:PIN domain nuclease of toxin-antitoxin system
MEYLLDTHTFLWFINGDAQLSEKAKNVIMDPEKEKYISIASLWEIAIKVNLGKLSLDITYDDLRLQIIGNGFEILPIMFEHTAALSSLELHHRDPFDRMIIAQALSEQLTVIGKDENFNKYNGLKLLW